MTHAARKRFPLASLAAIVVAAVLAFVALLQWRQWHQARATLAQLTSERETLTRKNRRLAGAHQVLVNEKVQICNKSSDDVTVKWISAAYQDGSQLRVFDSSRCRDWQTPTLGKGDSRSLNLSSMEENCNWNGSVIFYAMHLSRESESMTRSYNVAGAWRGFEQGCFTLE